MTSDEDILYAHRDDPDEWEDEPEDFEVRTSTDALWTEAEEDEAWDNGGPAGLARLAVERYAAETKRLREGLTHWLYDPWKYGMEGSIAYFESLLAPSTHDAFDSPEQR